MRQLPLLHHSPRDKGRGSPYCSISRFSYCLPVERDDFQILERDLCHIPPGQKSKTIAATDILETFSIPDILTSSVPACCSIPSPQSFAQQGVEPDALGSEGRLH